MLLSIISFSLSAILAFLLFPAIISLANSLGFVDHPSEERKTHKKATPVVGGIIIGFIVLAVYILLAVFTSYNDPFYMLIFAIFVLFLLIGGIDDRIDIPAKQKFIFQILCAILVVRNGLSLDSLNFIFDIDFPKWFVDGATVVIIVGALNAYNLVDGIDGLLGGFLTLAFSWLLFVAVSFGDSQMIWIILSVLGGLVVFLKYNFSSSKKVFMGDAGALSLGFLLIVLSINLFERTYNLHSEMNWMGMGIIAVLAVPILDTIIVFSRRINYFSSPFKADRTHLHHLVVNIKSNHKIATSMIIGFTIGLVLLSISLSYFENYFLAFCLIPTLTLIAYYLINKVQLFLKSQSIIEEVENK